MSSGESRRPEQDLDSEPLSRPSIPSQSMSCVIKDVGRSGENVAQLLIDFFFPFEIY